MDNQNAPIRNWNNSFASTQTPSKTIGRNFLSLAEFAFNSWRNESTKKSPFEVLMGYSPRAEWTTVSLLVPQVTHHLEQVQEARNQASIAMRKAQLGWIKDKEKKQHVFRKENQVWLDGRNIKTHHPTAKLAPKRHGPFPIQRVLLTINYQLTIPEQWKIHDVFHMDLLTPYRETRSESTRLNSSHSS